VFENRILRKGLGPQRQEVAGDGRRLHNEEFNNSYPSPNIIMVFKSRGKRWVGHGKRNAYNLLV
jgi:hypothetical protein